MALDPIVSSNSSARRWTDRISNALQKEVAIDFNLLPPICVLQVPKTLSHKKPEAYTPQLIGMGPYHHLRPDLYQMERYKLAAIKDILEPDQILNFKNLLIDKLRENDLVVRACYNRFMDLDEETLAWIVAIDGLFLVNILCSAYGNDVHDEHENNIDDTIFTRDFMMLENQIPFVVMKQIRKFLRLSSPQDREDTELISMFRRFCEMHSPLPLPAKSEYHRNNGKETRPLHLLDLMYHLILDDRVDFASVPIQMSSIVFKHDDKDEEDVQDEDTHEKIIHNFETILEVLEPIGPRNVQKLVKPINQVVEKVPWSTISGLFREGVEIHGDGESKNISTIPSASRLWCYAGVRCIPIPEGISRIKFEQASQTLYLPVITMNTGAEVLLRNLMVYEAAMSKSKFEFARYINLMSGVADAIKDVKLLRKAGVIKGDLTDNEIATLFSTMQRSFVRSNGSSNVAIAMEEVNKYYDQRLIVRARRRLKKNIYVSWKFLPVAMSISFVLLLLFQTFCSVYRCHNIWGNFRV
ncbi:putative LRR receptor-like serine/threonine-protein kinase-like [Capsicum annuum]|nr:putative LRR receptor-like serine/threonine-protein kinase-like [Capsicum annuum]